MKLFAKVIEGSLEDMVFHAECSQEGYNKLWRKGKDLWDVGELSKFEIGVFTDSYQLFWSIRPDKWNFEENRHKDCFMECAKEEFDSFSSPDFRGDSLELDFIHDKQKLWMSNPMFIERIDLRKCLETLAISTTNCGLTDNMEITHFDIYSKGDLKGYGQGILRDEVTDRSYEFLFRFEDAVNGPANSLVFIDYGWELKDSEKVFEVLEKRLQKFSEQFEDSLRKTGVISEKKVSLDEKMACVEKKIKKGKVDEKAKNKEMNLAKG